MAITDISAFAHLTPADVEGLGKELDAVRTSITESLGSRDAAYIRRVITAQRLLELSCRALLFASRRRWARWCGAAGLSLAKIIENMELGHNISHGQWDWMNDPEIHSATWEWDSAGPSDQWQRAHNYSHHTFTNVLGRDEDLGFGILRMTRDEPWKPLHLLQPVANALLAAGFEFGIALHDCGIDKKLSGVPRWQIASTPNRKLARKLGKQLAKDYLIYPALTGRAFFTTLRANAIANLIRNLWAYVVIFCGHFPDGAEKFTTEQLAAETRGQWYLRQMLGSANFRAGPALAFLSGNLCFQIEHHLFPDLPSNRCPEIARKVQAICDKYDLPYTTGSLGRQYLLAFRTIHKLALPDALLRRTADDAPETCSEHKFARTQGSDQWHDRDTTGSTRRRGLRWALQNSRWERKNRVSGPA